MASEIVLGIHTGHDATAAVVADGHVLAAVAEERLSRTKMHLGFPWRAIAEVLRTASIEPRDVDSVAFSFRAYLQAPPFVTKALLNQDGCTIPVDREIGAVDILGELLRQSRRRGGPSIPHPAVSSRFEAATSRLYRDALSQLGLRPDISMLAVDHHLGHAASCYLTSRFGKCVIVTADGAGDSLSSTWSRASDGSIERIAQCGDEVSLGKFYSAVTRFLGFVPHRHEGKVTGLAAFGDPDACREDLEPCIAYDARSKSFRTSLPLGGPLASIGRTARFFTGRLFRDRYFDAVLRHCRRRLSGRGREDVAAATQKILEEGATAYTADAVGRVGAENVALAGGVFANVCLNSAIADLAGVRSVFVHPNMGDGGTALGAALFASLGNGTTGWQRAERSFDVYLGPSSDEAAIRTALDRSGFSYRRSERIELEMARAVSAGLIVGRFDGRMEYGPRALGNRSILADPRRPGIHETLNDRLRRNDFMPFAPSILADRADRFLRDTAPRREAAAHMTICFDVLPERRQDFGGACHVDGTTRAHLVEESANPSFHRFLVAFERESGLPFTLNTSFNSHEEPIVCTPEQALTELSRGAIDTLAIGPFLVEGATGARRP